jgi:uncharacterized iron-regulated membrane protein
VITVRSTADRRIFWRDLHAVTGALGGGILLFLAVSGMPWSVFWGAQVQSRVAIGERGTPAAPAAVTPYFMLGAHAEPGGEVMEHHDHGGADPVPGTPWALEQVQPPTSVGTGEVIGLDAAIAKFDALGLARPYGVQPPEGPNGAYAATHLANKANETRQIYLDQYTGESLGEIAFADYGWASKTIEYGIAIHEGRQFGSANRYLMLLGSVAGLLLAVSSVTMWWKRRPKGTLAAPPAPEERRVKLFVLGAILVVGVIYPLTGASLLVALAIDFVWTRLGSRRRAVRA